MLRCFKCCVKSLTIIYLLHGAKTDTICDTRAVYFLSPIRLKFNLTGDNKKIPVKHKYITAHGVIITCVQLS